MGVITITRLCRGAGLQVSRLVAGCSMAYYRSPLERKQSAIVARLSRFAMGPGASKCPIHHQTTMTSGVCPILPMQ